MSNLIDTLPEYISAIQIRQAFGLPRSSLHRYMGKQGFPRGKQIGPNATRWVKQEVIAWYASREDAKVHPVDSKQAVA